MTIHDLAADCKKASIFMAALSTNVKNKALSEIITALKANRDKISVANKKDIDKAKKDKLDTSLLKRLKFDNDKIEEACEGLESLILLDDPVGATISALELDTDLELYKISRPIGVIGVIFESRPDALVQIASLCLKSGNGALLKGGSEASNTNQILAQIISDTSIKTGLAAGWIGLLETRSDVTDMLGLDKSIDLIIPRGSNAFVKHIMDNTVIPVLGHADGICHLYIDKFADLQMAIELAVDGKCQYVSVCNATETILIHEDAAQEILPGLKKTLEAQNVEIRGCKKTCTFIDVKTANEQDWKTEYLDYIVSIKIVPSLDKALDHINTYGSGHTDVIVTKNKKRALKFMDMADTADAFWNCSSRFSDGFRFGLGAEVGISTNKIHARGPVGLEGLMIYQWRMIGNGHMVADYAGKNAKSFTHQKLNTIFK